MVDIIDSKIIQYSSHRRIYSTENIITCIIDCITKSVPWSKYISPPEIGISGKYLNEYHNKYINAGVYEAIFEAYINIYLKKNREIKLKYQYLDSSFVQNKGGSIKNNKIKENNKIVQVNNINLPKNNKEKKKSFIDFNTHDSRKRCCKISCITDSLGAPLSLIMIPGKQSDNISVEETVNSIPVDLKTKQNSKFNRYKQYLLADSGYHSFKNKSSYYLLQQKKYKR